MRTAAVLLAWLCIAAAGLYAQSSASFLIETDVFDAGGLGYAAPRSASFTAISVLGQAAARSSSAGAAFDVSSGVACLFCGKSAPVGIDELAGLDGFFLGSAYPNPAKAAAGATVLVPYSVSSPSRLSLRVLDVYGRVVAILHDGDSAAGRHTASFDASALPSGAYAIVLEIRGFAVTRIVTVLR
ncbi:MAG: hypothetical protein IPP94_16970 [Ignavibacteria bacterium]|nr:hypothetical protein [Ignavibacteria bacterium]